MCVGYLKIVHGKPRHSQLQGSIERADQDIQNISATCMQTYNSKPRSEGKVRTINEV